MALDPATPAVTIHDLPTLTTRLTQSIQACIMGKDDTIEQLIAAVLAGGHILLEDLPGTGKTTLAKALAKAVQGEFRRIQFTPDLLPSELTGINYFNQKRQDFEFRPGALFTNILLADEINRATPRTQSSLLECMEERQVTVDGTTYRLEDPFLVIATQNPIESQGTFPLPEAQMDRFMVRLSLGYPSHDAELEMLSTYRDTSPLDQLEPVLTTATLQQMIEAVRTITVNEAVRAYIVKLADHTRHHEKIRLGISPRGALALMHMAQAFAAMDGASFVRPDHVQQAVRPTFMHRIILKGTTVDQRSEHVEAFLTELLAAVAVPTESLKPDEVQGA